MNEKLLRKNILLVLLFALIVIFLYFTSIIKEEFVPIIFAFFTAFLLHPIIMKLTGLKIPFWAATIIVYVLYIAFFITIIFILFISISNLATDIPNLINIVQQKVNMIILNLSKNEILKSFISFDKSTYNIEESLSEFITIKNFTTYILTPLNLLYSLLKGFGIYFIALIFIIPGVDKLPKKIHLAFPDERGGRINDIVQETIKKIQNYVFAKFVISLIVGLFSLAVCLIFRIKYPLLWACLIFLLNFIPFFGTFIALTLTLLMHFIQYQSLVYTVLLYASLMIIQIIMENIIQPKIISDSVNLSPIIIIISIFLWAYVWGFSGIILAVPTTSTINIIFNNINSLKPVSIMISAKQKTKKKTG